MKRMFYLVASLLVGAALMFTPANAKGAHHAPTLRPHATNGDRVNAMELDEWYQIAEGQHQHNVQQICDCTGYVWKRWTSKNGTRHKIVEYPIVDFDGNVSPYGDLIQYHVSKHGFSRTEKVKYLARGDDAEPFHYDRNGLVD